jgi:hypothetical protein
VERVEVWVDGYFLFGKGEINISNAVFSKFEPDFTAGRALLEKINTMPTTNVRPDCGQWLQDIADTLAKSRKVVVITGAGISTSCGIPVSSKIQIRYLLWTLNDLHIGLSLRKWTICTPSGPIRCSCTRQASSRRY